MQGILQRSDKESLLSAVCAEINSNLINTPHPQIAEFQTQTPEPVNQNP